MEEVGEQVTAFVEDAPKDFGDGEDKLAMRDGEADVVGDPAGGLEGAALVAGGAAVAGLAGEGEQAFVAALGAAETGEAGGEVAAAAESLHGGDGLGPERTHGGAVAFFVTGQEIIPCRVHDLPERRGAGAAGVVDGGGGCHAIKCSKKHNWQSAV